MHIEFILLYISFYNFLRDTPLSWLLVFCFSGEFEESSKLYQEALALARAAGDEEAVEQLQEGLKELASRRDGQTESKPEEQELKE